LPTWFVLGLGLSVASVPLLSLATNGIQAGDWAMAADCFTVSQQVGTVLGLALLSTIALSASGARAEVTTVTGIRTALAVSTGLGLAGCLQALLMLRPRFLAGRTRALSAEASLPAEFGLPPRKSQACRSRSAPMRALALIIHADGGLALDDG
jgi:hypothetical protein